MIHFGFSYIGLIFLFMLFIPNMIWTKHKPKDYEKYAENENKILLMFERIGEVLVCIIALIFSDFNFREPNLWSIWLVLAVLAMLLYEGYWIRYFHSEQKMTDFYSSFWESRLPEQVYQLQPFSFWEYTEQISFYCLQLSFWELVTSVFI